MGFGHAQGQRLQVRFDLLDELGAFERRFCLGNTFNIFVALKVIRQEIRHSKHPEPRKPVYLQFVSGAAGRCDGPLGEQRH